MISFNSLFRNMYCETNTLPPEKYLFQGLLNLEKLPLPISHTSVRLLTVFLSP